MRHGIALKIILLFLLLNFNSHVNVVNGQQSITFSEGIDFDFNNIIGSDGEDYLMASAADNEGNVYVGSNVFYIESTNRPWFYGGPLYDRDEDYKEFNITDDAWDTTYNGLGDIVLTKYNNDGDIVWSTYFGGTEKDEIDAIVINSDQDVILFGQTESEFDFPLLNANRTNPSSIQSTFIAKFDNNGTLVKSTFFGGTYLDGIHKAKMDDENNIIISGNTKSNDFPLVNPAIDRIPVDEFKPTAMLAKLNSDFEIIFSTQLGGNKIDNDYTFDINKNNEIIMMGLTKSVDFPITEGAIDDTHNGQIDGFFTKFSSEGQIIYSTFLGGTYVDWIDSIVIDDDNNVYLTGFSVSNDFPVKDGEDDELNDGVGRYSDAIFVKLDENGNLLYSSFFGGNNIDRGIELHMTGDGYLVMIGETKSVTYPIFGVSDASMRLNQGFEYAEGDPPSDVFIAKFAPDGRLAWSVLFGSTGVENVFHACFYGENKVIVIGNTFNNNNFPKTNAPIGGYLFDGYIARVDLPETALPPADEFNGYKGEVVNATDEISNITSNMSTENENEGLDMFSYIIIGISGGAIAIPVIQRTGLVNKLLNRNMNKDLKSDIDDYLGKLRDT